MVAYTLTIEQTGGSGIVVPGRGFLLNNELTDFNFTPTQGTAPDPNLPAPGKRPRSSMSPTIVLDDGRPVLALGSPGGSMIITTVLQTLLNRLDFGYSLPDALAAPRASQRNTASVSAEPAFIAAWGQRSRRARTRLPAWPRSELSPRSSGGRVGCSSPRPSRFAVGAGTPGSCGPKGDHQTSPSRQSQMISAERSSGIVTGNT